MVANAGDAGSSAEMEASAGVDARRARRAGGAEAERGRVGRLRGGAIARALEGDEREEGSFRSCRGACASSHEAMDAADELSEISRKNAAARRSAGGGGSSSRRKSGEAARDGSAGRRKRESTAAASADDDDRPSDADEQRRRSHRRSQQRRSKEAAEEDAGAGGGGGKGGVEDVRGRTGRREWAWKEESGGQRRGTEEARETAAARPPAQQRQPHGSGCGARASDAAARSGSGAERSAARRWSSRAHSRPLEAGRPVRVARFDDDHRLELREDVLARVLLREDVRDRPVVLVAVVGSYRKGETRYARTPSLFSNNATRSFGHCRRVLSVAGGRVCCAGKSFLLSYMLRYLRAWESAGAGSGSSSRAGAGVEWLGDAEQPLAEGFEWRGGAELATTGLVLWSRPFLRAAPGGEQVAVLLLDTQGATRPPSPSLGCQSVGLRCRGHAGREREPVSQRLIASAGSSWMAWACDVVGTLLGKESPHLGT
ncbi:Uncharacterized protein GBIM_14143 [Gryllus bimaculatus]|nr:Uncharacterized protein GBIM_14143 [Gryllus bimaculatus]